MNEEVILLLSPIHMQDFVSICIFLTSFVGVAGFIKFLPNNRNNKGQKNDKERYGGDDGI